MNTQLGIYAVRPMLCEAEVFAHVPRQLLNSCDSADDMLDEKWLSPLVVVLAPNSKKGRAKLIVLYAAALAEFQGRRETEE